MRYMCDDEKGDLAKKKIYPVLWCLFRDNLLPKPTAIVGYARSPLTVQQLRKQCDAYTKVNLDEAQKYKEFWNLNHYVSGMYDSQEDFVRLNNILNKHEQGDVAHRIFYLALPPTVFRNVTVHIKNSCMAKK